MRPSFLYALFLVLAVGGIYFYTIGTGLCRAPLAYSIGTIDAGFSITHDEAVSALAAAEQAWESAVDRDILYLSEDDGVTINFVFDDRQASTIEEEQLRDKLDDKEKTNESIGAQYNELLKEYEALESEYEQRVNDYDARLQTFNDTVAKYNDQGGAPQEAYDDLLAEEQALQQEASELEKEADHLAAIVADLNQLGEEGNRLISQYNKEVEAYNANFGEAREFTQGDYQNKHINIYTFVDRAELIRVLVHELGHALGLGHVEGRTSMMYYLMEDQPKDAALSKEDVAAFNNMCGTKDSFRARVSVMMNSLLSNFN